MTIAAAVAVVAISLTGCGAPDPSSTGQWLQGTWNCDVTKGDEFRLNVSDQGNGRTAIYQGFPELVTITDKTWEIIDPKSYQGVGTKMEGDYSISGGELKITTKNYSYANGSTDKPFPLPQDAVGHPGTIKGLPEKVGGLSMVAFPQTQDSVKLETGTSTFTLVSTSSTLSCSKLLK